MSKKPSTPGVVITSLEVQDFKRVSLVRYDPKPSGLCVIGGRNAQGKTSTLDAAKLLFGGEKFTYTINPDALYPNGWLQPAQNFAASNTMFSVFLALSITAPSCNFTDPINTAITNGYPTLYFPCAEVVVSSNADLTTNAALLNEPLGVLLCRRSPARR